MTWGFLTMISGNMASVLTNRKRDEMFLMVCMKVCLTSGGSICTPGSDFASRQMLLRLEQKHPR